RVRQQNGGVSPRATHSRRDLQSRHDRGQSYSWSQNRRLSRQTRKWTQKGEVRVACKGNAPSRNNCKAGPLGCFPLPRGRSNSERMGGTGTHHATQRARSAGCR
ncbi:MAG: hypothetical protein BJ554DRAFT_1732, partial [Olpidium bornovanus]